MADVTAELGVDGEPERELPARRRTGDLIRLTDRDLDPAKIVLSYDRASDTLLLFLYGRERRSVVIGGTDYVFSLVDSDTNEFVGVQIEDFLARAVPAEPRLIELLEYAELRDMTADDVRRGRRATLRYGGRLHAWAEHQLRVRRRSIEERKLDVILSLLNDEQLGLPFQRSHGAV